jgi:hypothetical protein
MVWNTECFRDLESRVIATMRGLRSVIDVPFYVYLYEPRDELICLREFGDFVSRLNAKDLSAESISLSALMIEALKELGCLEESVLKSEDRDRSVLARDLERELPKEIAKRLRSRFGDKDESHCLILLRASALYPFVHVSSLLSSIEGAVRCTLVIPYPGNNVGEMLNVKGLGARKYYRAEIIGKGG